MVGVVVSVRVILTLGVACLALASVPLAPAQPEPGLTFSDPSDDTQPEPAQYPNGPGSPIVDIRRFSITSEDESEVVLKLEVGPWKTDRGTAAAAYGVDLQIEIAFSLTDELTYRLGALIFGLRPADGSNEIIFYTWQHTADLDQRFADNEISDWDVLFQQDPQAGTFEFHVPKAALQPRYAGSASSRPALPDFGKGSIVRDFRVETQLVEHVPIASGVLSHTDLAPDAGPPTATYTIQQPVANKELIIASPRSSSFGGPAHRSYAPGLNQTFEFTVRNVEGPRRLVRLTYAIRDTPDATGFEVFGPSSVTIPSGETRNYTFSFRSPPETHAPLAVRIRGESLGTSAVGATDIRLQNGTILDPTHNTLRVYGHRMPSGGINEACGTVQYCSNWGTLSARINPPELASDVIIPVPDRIYTDYRMRLDNPLGGPAALAPGGSIEATIRLVPLHRDIDSAEIHVVVGVQFAGSSNVRTLVDLKQTQPISADGSTFTLKGVPKITDFILGREDSLSFNVAATPVTAGPGIPDYYGYYNNPIGLSAAESKVMFPLTELPPELKVNAIPSPFQIALRAGEESDEWVNPGKARLFNMTVLNFDGVEQHLRLNVSSSRPWPVEVLPGRAFDLAPGQSITVGVLIRSPLDTPSGEADDVWVNATADVGASVGLKLHLTSITNGDDLGDDTGKFQADQDDIDALEKTPETSPAWGLLAVVAAFVAALAQRRRSLL